MKKYIALILSFVLIFSSFSYAWADEGSSGKHIIKEFKNYDVTLFEPYDQVTLYDDERADYESYLPETVTVITEEGKELKMPAAWEGDSPVGNDRDFFIYTLVLPEGYELSEELSELKESEEGDIPFVIIQIDMTCSAEPNVDENGEIIPEYIEARSDYPFRNIRNTWKEISDEELNEYISNNNDKDISKFIYSLSREDRSLLFRKNTMLRNDTEYEDENGEKKTLPYYRYIQMMYPEFQTYATSYNKMSGYCYYAFTANGSTTKYKVSFTISGSASGAQGTSAPSFSVSSTVASGSSSTFSASFSANGSVKKGLTTNADWGMGTPETTSVGTVYKTKIWEVFYLNISVKKPAYTYPDKSGVSTSNALSNYRMNFKGYNWQNTKESSLDEKQGIYKTAQTMSITSQVHIRNAGIGYTGNTTSTNATMTLPFEHPVLNIKYYKGNSAASAPNGNPVTGSRPYDSTQRVCKSVINTCGFSWTGHYITASEAWRNNNSTSFWSSTSPGYTAEQILDFSNGDEFKSKTVSLYANWKESSSSTTATLTYNANGGSGAPSSQSMTYSAATYVSTTTPTRSGYTFAGWNTNSSGTGTNYSSGELFKAANVTPTDTTLYAKWNSNSTVVPNPPTTDDGFYIYYDANGGSGAPSAHYINPTGDLSNIEPVRPGYTFIGWSAYSWSRSNRISYYSHTSTVDGTSSTMTLPSWGKTEYGNALGVSIGSSVTLYAQWDSDGSSSNEGFWIFFDANGGTGAPSYARSTTATDIPSTVPTREGYKFMGWGGTSSWCTKRVAYYGGQVAKDGSVTRTTSSWTKSQWETNAGMTFYNISSGPDDEYPYAGFLYAQWEEEDKGFTINYNANGGTGAPSPTIITETGNISSTKPTREGYKFIGWSRDAKVTSPRISYTSITAADGTSSTQTANSWGKTEYGNALGTTIGTSVTIYAQWEEVNEPPKITAPDRVFFLHETVDKDELIRLVKVTDKEDGKIPTKDYTDLKIYKVNEDDTKTLIVLGDDDKLDTSDPDLKYEIHIKYKDSKDKEVEGIFKATIFKVVQPKQLKSYPRFIRADMIWTLDPNSVWLIEPLYSELVTSLNRTEPIFASNLFTEEVTVGSKENIK